MNQERNCKFVPGWNSTEFSLTQMMKVGSFTRRLISSMISKTIRERLSRSPPYSSVRLFVVRDRN